MATASRQARRNAGTPPLVSSTRRPPRRTAATGAGAARPHVEMATSDGRIYRLAVKRDRPSRGAMAQIEAKRYARHGREVSKLGVRFASGTRSIEDRIIRVAGKEDTIMGVEDGPLQAMQA